MLKKSFVFLALCVTMLSVESKAVLTGQFAFRAALNTAVSLVQAAPFLRNATHAHGYRKGALIGAGALFVGGALTDALAIGAVRLACKNKKMASLTAKEERLAAQAYSVASWQNFGSCCGTVFWLMNELYHKRGEGFLVWSNVLAAGWRTYLTVTYGDWAFKAIVRAQKKESPDGFEDLTA
ncbi:TPA: hypothetical protein DDZ86_01855 [Candidatus Dependentiae bacterium]|nr:hypothetical protein [Candidatus Dependentiae bacterium]